jgi:hypothetical protein
MSSNFVTPSYLMQYPQTPSVNDYRCVVNAAGTQVIFERSPYATSAVAKNDADLYILDLTPNSQPSKFLNAPNMPLPAHSDRPDWSWQTGGLVIFNWIGPDGSLQVGLATNDGSTVQPLKHTHNMSYPTWFPDWSLAVMDHDKAASPNPSTSKIDMDGKMRQRALAGSTLLAGMPSVNQQSPNLIAFAGQFVGSPPVKYDQDRNYIWVVDLSTRAVAPLEGSGLSSGPFQPAYQGRAPWWSPDGNWVVFESYRADPPPANNGKGMYAIYLFDYSAANATAVQLTDPMYDMNHAKWYPNGFNGVEGDQTLVVAAYQPDGGGGAALPYGIASLDVSSFISTASRDKKKNV